MNLNINIMFKSLLYTYKLNELVMNLINIMFKSLLYTNNELEH